MGGLGIRRVAVARQLVAPVDACAGALGAAPDLEPVVGGIGGDCEVGDCKARCGDGELVVRIVIRCKLRLLDRDFFWRLRGPLRDLDEDNSIKMPCDRLLSVGITRQPEVAIWLSEWIKEGGCADTTRAVLFLEEQWQLPPRQAVPLLA